MHPPFSEEAITSSSAITRPTDTAPAISTRATAVSAQAAITATAASCLRSEPSVCRSRRSSASRKK